MSKTRFISSSSSSSSTDDGDEREPSSSYDLGSGLVTASQQGDVKSLLAHVAHGALDPSRSSTSSTNNTTAMTTTSMVEAGAFGLALLAAVGANNPVAVANEGGGAEGGDVGQAVVVSTGAVCVEALLLNQNLANGSAGGGGANEGGGGGGGGGVKQAKQTALEAAQACGNQAAESVLEEALK